MDGKKQSLHASEVSSYFDGSRKRSIQIQPDDRHVFVQTILQGPVFLARYFTSAKKERFCIKTNNQWYELPPNEENLKVFITNLVPDFSEAVDTEYLYYDLVSLGKAINTYNGFADPSYMRVGKFKYTDQVRFGFFASASLSRIQVKNSSLASNTLFSPKIGAGLKVQYNPLFSFLLQAGYVQESTQNESYYFDLKTVDITSMIDYKFYRNPVGMELSIALGFNINMEIASELISLKSINNQDVGLSGLSFGYACQVHGTFKNKYDLFLSTQYMPIVNSQSLGTIVVSTIEFQKFTIGIGFMYYL